MITAFRDSAKYHGVAATNTPVPTEERSMSTTTVRGSSSTSITNIVVLLASVALFLVMGRLPARASVAVYVGKNRTSDGSVLLAGFGDEPSSHWLRIAPRHHPPPGSTLSVGSTAESAFPGQLIEIPQVSETYKYISMDYSYFRGFPPPLTNGGMNEFHVAARDVALWSRAELTQMTPKPQSGPNYSELSRIVLERAKTAREAAEIVGALIDEYGFSTYGGNSHVFADANEGWVLLNFAGGQRLWIAKRLGPDDIWLNWRGHNEFGYIQEVPLNFQDDPDYLGSDHFISFAVEQGWYDRDLGKPFNVIDVYCRKSQYAEAISVRDRLLALTPEIGVKDLMHILRDVGRDSSGYGQVAHLRSKLHSDLGLLWCAPSSAVTAPFIPYWIGVEEALPEFRRHRYLTAGEDRRMISNEWRGLESTRYANRVSKRLLYLVDEHRDKFLPEVTEALGAFEDRLLLEQAAVEQTARILLEAGETELAREYLTRYTQTEAANGLRLVEDLATGVEARSKVLFGVRVPEE